ncbi:MAG: PHG11b 33 [Candidatus Saccharibacteria bacterium]|nr:PHG11b 33 [Candidatus Saccharibacteria bacterium]
MIILKDPTQTLQLNTVTGLAAPTRKGFMHAVGVGTGVTLTPDGTIAVGDWMIIVVVTFNGITATTPSGWTVLQPMTLTGTQNTVIYGKLRAVGDTSYTVLLSAGVISSDGTLFWGSGSDVVSSWIIGTTMARASITPTTSTDTVAPSITTTTDHTLVLSFATERTTPDEGDIVSMTGAQKWKYFAQNGTIDIQTTAVGVVRDVSPAGATSDVRFTYVNAQANNGQGIQIGIPAAKTVSIDSSATYIDINSAGTTVMSAWDTKLQLGVGSTIFSDETPLNENTPTDTSSLELGLTFTAGASGTVTAIRYYKGVGASTASKDGHLWSSGGTLLASVTFVNETASGWQTQYLSTPVTLTNGSNYIVSYYTPDGNYSRTPPSSYFGGNFKHSGPLSVSFGNPGRFTHTSTSGTFPASSDSTTLYFVDVIFQIDPQKAMWPALIALSSTQQRELKQLTVVNNGTQTNNVSLSKQQVSSSYLLTPLTPLAPGEMLQYDDKVGWRLYAADATIKANFAAPSVNTAQIASNNNGAISSSTDLTWVRAQDTLSITGSNGPGLQLGIVSATPTVPAVSTLGLYSQRIGGKMQLMKQDPGGDYEAVQASLWQNSFVSWTPSSTVGIWTGSAGSFTGSPAQVLPTTTNVYTAMRRSTFATTGANTQAGLSSDVMFLMGFDQGIGGFFYTCRFGFDSIKTGGRAFIGLTPNTVITTSEPSSLINMCGFGFDSTDSAFTFMHNDAAGTATKEAISGQGTLATNNTGYDAYIWNPSGSGTIYYRLERTDTGATLAEGSVTGDTPTSNTLLTAVAYCGGGTNTVSGDLTIGVNRLYVETSR